MRQGWGGRPVRIEQAQGILVAALGMLAGHYGYARANLSSPTSPVQARHAAQFGATAVSGKKIGRTTVATAHSSRFSGSPTLTKSVNL